MQNGIAERSNRTLVDLARTILISTGLPKSLWAEAINYCVQILNVTTIHKTSNKSAHEMIYGSRPFLSKIRPFGTKCFFHNHRPGRSKFDPKSFPGVLVGFGENVDGYRIWVPGTKRIEKTKDVVFPKRSPFPASESSTDETEQSVASTAEDISKNVESITGKEDAPAFTTSDKVPAEVNPAPPSQEDEGELQHSSTRFGTAPSPLDAEGEQQPNVSRSGSGQRATKTAVESSPESVIDVTTQQATQEKKCDASSKTRRK